MTDIVLRTVVDGFGGGESFDIVDRETGEVLDPTKPEVQAAALNATRREMARLGAFRRGLTDMLVSYSTERGERTFTLPGGIKAVREGGPVTEYDDPAGLERELLDAGCPADRVATIVVTTIDKKVSGMEAAKASRANPEYAAIIERHARTVDRPYSIKLG